MRKLYFVLTLLMVCVLVNSDGLADIENYGRGNRVTDEMNVSPGAVRGAVIENENQLIGGPKAEGRIGDFVIYNNRVSFVICGVRPSTGWSPFGGVVEDAGVAIDSPDGLYWWNIMGEAPLILYRGSNAMFSGRLLAPVKAELIKDGSDGEAVVRILARDTEFELRDETTGVSSSSMKIKVMIDYILRPDTNLLEIKVTAINGKSSRNVIGIGKLINMGDGANVFAYGRGFDRGKVDGLELPFFAVDAGVVSYAWFASAGNVTIQTKISAPYILSMDTLKIPAKGEISLSLYLAAGAGGIDSVYRTYLKQRNITDTGLVSGVLSDSKGPVSDAASVSLLDEDGNVLDRTYPVADGSYEMAALPGKYSVQAWSYDRELPAPAPVEVKPGETSIADIEMPLPAVLEYKVSGSDGSAIPAMISFKKTGGQQNPPDALFFENRNGGGFYKNVFTVTGDGSVAFRPGKYDVYFSRGLEYEYAKEEVDVSAGDHVPLQVVLERAVDPEGFLSGDFHIHSAPSFDTSDTIAEKVRTAYINGIEIPIATDHNMRTDYNPTIRELGLDKYVKSIIGCEITTMRLGHFNTFPLTHKPDDRNDGAVEYMDRPLPEVFAEERADSDKRVVLQLNHPRVTAGGYLGFVQYQPETGEAFDKVNFTLDFDVIEVLNNDFYKAMDDTMIDWFSFLNRGKLATGTGNSDSHRVYNVQLGYPRNYIRSTTDIPGEMVESEFIESVLGQHITVSGGPLIIAEINGEAGVGDLLTDTDGEIDLNIEVHAPSWIEVDKLTVYANGEVVHSGPIEMQSAPVIYSETIKLKAEKDSWFIVRVEGEKDLFPVYPGRHAVSFTNPIYVDTDGNGEYDAPMSF